MGHPNVDQHMAREAGEAVVGTALAWLPTTLLDGHFTNIRWRLYFVGKTLETFLLNNPVLIYPKQESSSNFRGS